MPRVEHFLAKLGPGQIALDLGCGRGSFHYESYPCQIIGIDLTISAPHRYRDGARVSYVLADSDAIPLSAQSVDAVISHNTIEHFADYRRTLQEVDRVMKDQGLLWIAVPNGFGFDDSLYRLVYSGGGHLNRFTRDGLISAVHELTRFRLKQEVELFSSFIYLKRPTAEEYEHFPRSARALYHMPEEFNKAGVLAINAMTRVTDKLFGSRLSRYGWGFVFGHENAVLPPMHAPYFNVCSRCGSELPTSALRDRCTKTVLGVGFYICPNCGERNSFVEPPAGLA